MISQFSDVWNIIYTNYTYPVYTILQIVYDSDVRCIPKNDITFSVTLTSTDNLSLVSQHIWHYSQNTYVVVHLFDLIL